MPLSAGDLRFALQSTPIERPLSDTVTTAVASTRVTRAQCTRLTDNALIPSRLPKPESDSAGDTRTFDNRYQAGVRSCYGSGTRFLEVGEIRPTRRLS